MWNCGLPLVALLKTKQKRTCRMQLYGETFGKFFYDEN